MDLSADQATAWTRIAAVLRASGVDLDEPGLTAETGVTYQSVAYLLEKCSRPQETC